MAEQAAINNWLASLKKIGLSTAKTEISKSTSCSSTCDGVLPPTASNPDATPDSSDTTLDFNSFLQRELQRVAVLPRNDADDNYSSDDENASEEEVNSSNRSAHDESSRYLSKNNLYNAVTNYCLSYFSI